MRMLLVLLRRRRPAPAYAAIDEKTSTCAGPNGPAQAKRSHRPNSVHQVVMNTFVFALSLIEKVSECAPVPGLKGAVGAFHILMQRFEDSEDNMHDFKDFVSGIDSLNHILSMFEDTSTTGRGLTDDLGEQLYVLSRELTVLKGQIKAIKKHSRLRRMIEARHDAQTIVRSFRRVQGFINEVMVGSTLKAEIRLADLWALEHLDKLPRAKDARYDYINRPLCSEGTREGVLKQIMKWVKNPRAHQIYWLNGAAGTGKTTIALTVADILAKDSTIFSASFFCSRESEGRSDARLIFPTFAYLFARCDVQLRNRIVHVIKDSPDIGHALPREQLVKLLIGPLRKVYTGTQRPIVLVLDALDECTGGRAPETILTALATEIRSVPFVKVFVSSRRTAATSDAFSIDALRQRREVFVLHDVEKDVVDADIREYMMDRLGRAAALRGLSTRPWPPGNLINKLVEMAGGLFIFASTVCEFIEARGDLDFRLKEITDRPTNEYTGIDSLYREILEYAIGEFPDQATVDHCRSIIGTIILLQDPLSSYDLSQLLQLPPKHIQGILLDLQSVLSVPDDVHGAIRTLHASFPDFISARARCLPAMYVEPSPQHRMIVMRLLEIMREGLKRNMAYFIRFKLNKEKHFPGSLRYACRYWADHLSRTNAENADDLVEALSHFTESVDFAYCLEVLESLSNPLEELSRGIIEKAEAWLSDMSESPQALTVSLNHARRLLQVDAPGPSLFCLFGLSPDTRYAQREYGRMCSDGTRNGVLESILQWANGPYTSQLYWLNGAAGTGKTTVAMTAADLVTMDRSKLTATFFCSRYSRYRRHVQHLFVSLSILLAAREARFREQLVNAVRRNPQIIQSHPRNQLRILIVEPLQLAGLSGRPIVFVIDALDECRPLEEDAPGKILSALAEHLHKVPSLKVLISTRPSLSLSRELKHASWNMPPIQFNLHDVDRSLVDDDIRRYLFEVLCTNAGIMERLSPNWPPDELLDKLVKKAGGSFIYASFMAQRFVLVGSQKLREIADDPGSEYEGHLGLNLFYGRMLKHILKGDEEKAKHFRAILGFLTHLHKPITLNDFETLVDIPEKALHFRLLELECIVVVSSATNLIRPIHESIRHWLTDKNRALPELFVDSADVHEDILSRLISCMTSGLDRSSRVSMFAIGDIESTSEEPDEGLLDYACRYWVEHLKNTSPASCLQADIENFLETKLVFWIERLYSSGELMVAAAALEHARTWYHEVSQPRHECVKAFADAQQLLMERSMMGALG
ncbi:hypothetical protein LshimejAT787_0310720 [Lyophyllum shimeji]|uniref:NACHT domain-containing protein n=1 Tax=Lyophyllum shimeji TaxID=47721 RepID=A0A9P3PIX0_LYOSH|nr:hypothetical protein LshimejAT787_0310720 [Lyophyllum shimeji]